ncbi:hypothetical protein KC318_g3226 [Hortaea werneckii]|uniref:Uncharacterized protein n=1 Tax=Hortaea werneckii TaxID=91943 RepID=A0A3M7AM20_HORWE|nr:hypothetical protein KC334_g3403 [Hortaea werneckii]KAI7018883.1 hypothetical protein KC355_g3215 [Hortaea werneckii]KAI7671845.1 hypothetical protein KC318_g3226 [Hortaea werneckii]RMY21029.1 hypothetical protein D0867_03583 [Hortaea werneckii]RMY28379.1 hypothetical protein D0866_09460 [Hortaea werneckii]
MAQFRTHNLHHSLRISRNTESKVVGLGEYGKSPYLHATGFKIPVLASASRYFRDLNLKEFYRINTFGYEMRGKDDKALSDGMMLHVELYRLPAPSEKNSTPQGQEGIGRAITLPSLYIGRLHVRLPARLRIARTRTIKFDTDDATDQFERAVVLYPQVWRLELKGHQLFHNMCNIPLKDVDWTKPLLLVPGLGHDRTPRCTDRGLTCNSRWLAAKLERWSGGLADPNLPQLDVMGNGNAVSIYVGVLSGRTPSSASMSDLFDAYKLADHLLDEPAKIVIMNAIIDLCSTRGNMDAIDVDYVPEYMSMTSFGEYERELVENARPCGSDRTPMLIN